MRRTVIAAILAALVIATQAEPALAGEQWCEEDPVLTIDGRTVDYTASFPSSYLDGATVNWTFHIPQNVVVASAITPPAAGSPAIPSTVRIVRDLPAYRTLATATVVTTVSVTASATFAMSTAVWGANSGWTTYAGRSNKPLTFSTDYSTLPLLY